MQVHGAVRLVAVEIEGHGHHRRVHPEQRDDHVTRDAQIRQTVEVSVEKFHVVVPRVLPGGRNTRYMRSVRDRVNIADRRRLLHWTRSEEHTSELHHTVISYAVFCLKKKKTTRSPSSPLSQTNKEKSPKKNDRRR